MTTSFPYVNSGSGYDSTSYEIGWDSVAGDILVATWAGWPYTDYGPTTVSDTVGNTWTIIGTSNGVAANQQELMIIAIATGIKAAAANTNTVTWETVTLRLPSQIEISVYECGAPSTAYAWSLVGQTDTALGLINSIDQAHIANAPNMSVQFRSTIVQGAVGGADAPDTGLVSVEIFSQGSDEDSSNSNLVGVAFIDPLWGAHLVVGNFNTAGPPVSPFFVVTNGTLRTTVYAEGPYGNTASGLADGDFPYSPAPLPPAPGYQQWIVQSVRLTDTNKMKSYRVSLIAGATVGDWKTALKFAIGGT